jgi:hypothetical protein
VCDHTLAVWDDDDVCDDLSSQHTPATSGGYCATRRCARVVVELRECVGWLEFVAVTSLIDFRNVARHRFPDENDCT